MGRHATSDIDRLIEMGLSRYGAGDLDGALLLWEEALAIDPTNLRATSYVDYVRLNFELLTGEPAVEESSAAPYPIEEEPEYQIEIVAGEAAPAPATALAIDPVDEGWFSDEETHDATAAPPAAGEGDADEVAEHPTLELETEEPESITMEADEPPEPISLEADEPPQELTLDADEPPLPEHNFDAGKTREYHGDVQRSSEPIVPRPQDADSLDDGTAGPTMGFFRPDDLTGGATQGYFRGDEATSYEDEAAPLKASADTENELQEDLATEGFRSEGTPVGFANLETEIRKRNLGFVQPVGTPKATKDEPSSPISIGTAPTQDHIAFEETRERSPFIGSASASVEQATDDDDLLEGLPTPRPMARQPESGEIELPDRSTLDLPQSSRQPARRDSSAVSQAEVVLAHAPTRDLSANEFGPVMSAPTRELGLRPPVGRPQGGPPLIGDDDDAPTGQSDVRAIRAAHARNDGATDVPQREGTQHDIVLPFDPIAAASAQILETVDAEAPAGESTDDTTRRRITRLLEKAGDWNDAGELDKAVTALDLALSEDPNSALAQKLITRNKDTIMQLFQAFLGDLDRTPQLAKPLHELAGAPINPRAAFLLSRIDGMLTIDELLDVSGMPRLEAYRHLCQLFLRGILR